MSIGVVMFAALENDSTEGSKQPGV
jgi:hypothetical protein